MALRYPSSPTGNVSSLPKWAQEYISCLERERKELGDTLNETVSGTGWRTPVAHRTSSILDEDIPVAWDNDRIRFDVRGEWVEVGVRDGALQIMSSGTIAVRPDASNHIHIEVN